jgi:hypothetical protein
MSVASFHRLTAAQPNLSHDPHRHHAHAFEAIAATLPLDSMGYEPQLNAKGEARLKRVKTFCFNREHINLPPAEFVELFRAESVYPELQKKLGIASTNEQPSNAQSTIDVVERSEAEQGDEQPDPASRTAQLAVGGVMFAGGVIYLVWLATSLASEDMIALVQNAWPFGDLIFGPAAS